MDYPGVVAVFKSIQDEEIKTYLLMVILANIEKKAARSSSDA